MEQIVGVLKQAQVGVPVAQVIGKAGIGEQSFYRWKAKYAGLEADQVWKMAQLQEKNMRLKQLVAELTDDLPSSKLTRSTNRVANAYPRDSTGDGPVGLSEWSKDRLLQAG